MSIRAKSAMKLKTSPRDKKKKNGSAWNSLLKSKKLLRDSNTWKNIVKKNFNSPNSSKKCNRHKSSVRTVRTNLSPFPISQLENSLKFFDSSIRTLDKSSFLERSSEGNTVGSPAFENPNKIIDSFEFSEKLGLCQRQNSELQAKIAKLQKRSSDSVSKLKVLQENYQNYPDLKENCFKHRKSALSRKKEDSSSQRNLNIKEFQDLKTKYKKKLQNFKQEVEEKIKIDSQELKKRQELKFKQRILEINSEYQRKLELAADENEWLRTQNEKFKRKVDDLESRLGLAERMNKGGKVYEDKTNDQNRKYNELLKQHMQLQHDYLHVKNEGNGLCQKCKVLMNTNSEISGKISRIRAYIDSSNNEFNVV